MSVDSEVISYAIVKSRNSDLNDRKFSRVDLTTWYSIGSGSKVINSGDINRSPTYRECYGII